jgi:hypothetical protein
MAGRVVEVDESQFIGMTQTAKTVQAMLANPKSRKMLLQAQKLADPSVSIPEIDALGEGMSEIQKLRAEMDADRKARADERAAAEAEAKTRQFVEGWEAGKKRLRAESGYTAEGIAAIEKLAQDRGIADLDAAAALFDRMNPPAEPIAAPGVGGFNFFEPAAATDNSGEYMKKLFASRGEDESATRTEVAAALSEFRGSRRAA